MISNFFKEVFGLTEVNEYRKPVDGNCSCGGKLLSINDVVVCWNCEELTWECDCRTQEEEDD